MPNWVYNTLWVQGDEVTVTALREKMNSPFETEHYLWDGTVDKKVYSNPVFAFWNIVKPDNLDKYFATVGSDTGNESDPDNWYNWNIRNWGTKWEVADNSYYEEQDEPDSLVYRFETAWSPPMEALLLLSSQFPTLRFDYRYEEEQGWGGAGWFVGGVYHEEESWDIPESHADYQELGRTCPCEYGIDWEFDDCPSKKESE